jgi:hypothetical protein
VSRRIPSTWTPAKTVGDIARRRERSNREIVRSAMADLRESLRIAHSSPEDSERLVRLALQCLDIVGEEGVP